MAARFISSVEVVPISAAVWYWFPPTPHQRILKDLLYSRGRGFLAVVWLGPSPTLSPISKLSLFLSLPLCRRSSLLTGVWGEGRRSQIIQQRESLLLYKSFTTLSPTVNCITVCWEKSQLIQQRESLVLYKSFNTLFPKSTLLQCIGRGAKSYNSEKAWSYINHILCPTVNSIIVYWERSQIIKKRECLVLYKSFTTLYPTVMYYSVLGEEPNHIIARKPGLVLYKSFNTLCPIVNFITMCWERSLII
jgi:hypothetical protein